MRLSEPRCLASHHILHQTSKGLSHTCRARGDHADVHRERLSSAARQCVTARRPRGKMPKRLRLVCQLLLSLLFSGELAPHTKALRHNLCAILHTRTRKVCQRLLCRAHFCHLGTLLVRTRRAVLRTPSPTNAEESPGTGTCATRRRRGMLPN